MSQPIQRVLITGLNGTLAPVLAESFVNLGIDVVGWDRSRFAPEDPNSLHRLVEAHQPQALCHLATGSPDWARTLAAGCQQLAMPLLFTSTAMVFDAQVDGPYSTSSQANPQDDYGRMKLASEQSIRQAYPQALIARIGWQIGDKRGGNNMLEALHRQMEENGKVVASKAWVPATSFMQDTADTLASLLIQRQQGLFHLDSNAVDQMTFADLVKRLNAAFNCHWLIETNTSYQHDQRLIDARAIMPKLSCRI